MSSVLKVAVSRLLSGRLGDRGSSATNLLGMNAEDLYLPIPKYWNGASIALGLLVLFTICALYDQYSYQTQKGKLPGPKWKLPFLGVFLDSLNPSFKKYMEQMGNDLLCISVFHKVRTLFVVLVSTKDLARKVWNSPDYARLCGTAGAEKFFSPTSWVFLDGKAHENYRRGLNGLFNRNAVESYLPILERTHEEYFDKLVEISRMANGQPIAVMEIFKELLGVASTRIILGAYLTDQEAVQVAKDFYQITAALELVNFPFVLPFTKQWYGQKATRKIVGQLTVCAANAKAKIAAGGAVTCVLDDWIAQMRDARNWEARREAGEKLDEANRPTHLLRDFSNQEIAETMLSFYFAALDTSSSALTWLFQLTADNPSWLTALREENLRIRDGDIARPVTMDILDRMKVTQAVVKETLRFRSPAIALPRLVKKDFPLAPSFTARKGQMLMPSVWKITHDPEAYPEPDSFRPERWISGDAERHTKNWVVFGSGPHSCIGKTYAMANLVTLIGKASMMVDWEHVRSEESDEIMIFSTIFPKDGCRLIFRRRSEAPASAISST